MSRQKKISQLVKIGTMPRNVVWVAKPAGGFVTGQTIQWRDTGEGGKWQEARIWQIGPPPESLLYLEQ